MAEDLTIIKGDKQEQYESLIPQIKALVEGETDLIANLGNISAALKEQFNWLWIGFYLVKGDELVLGPFQGPVACTRIKKGKGVCGTALKEGKTLIIRDVSKFGGHIACNSGSRSEIVIPVSKNDIIWAVLDADSSELNNFDETDGYYLEKIIDLISLNSSNPIP